LNIIRLGKESLQEALNNSEIFGNIMELVKNYPWNNFLQLKVINICNEVVTVNQDAEFRTKFLEKSGMAKACIEMQEKAMIP
jgi:hypothetical protein